MSKKVNFTKVENAFDNALKKIFIDNLSELAAIATIIHTPESNLSSQTIEEIIGRFQKELKRLKKQDIKLYQRLNLSEEEANRFALSSDQYTQADWLRLRSLKERIDELKRELYGEDILDVENEKRVAKERNRHINKRFNIREGWLPL
jgi:16S rRNA C967 or C1407 C5-methylase (RsmB/RsmF family)